MTPLWQREPVGVVGLGLIGGSLGLDLMAMGAQVRALVHRPATAERAAQRGLATEVSTDPAVLEGCGLVVLALPLDRLLDPEPALVAALPAGAVITDVGSVKAPVLRRWRELLAATGGGPAPWRFVASHPMAGTARAGVEAGEPGLFRGRPWVATPEAGTDPAALEAMRELAEALGARWLCCDAEAHDRAVALISHLPVLVGAALLQAANAGGGAEAGAALVRALASSGFADTTRVGGGNPELGMLMARANRAALLEALGHYRHSLACLEAMVAGEQWSDLQQSLELSQRLRPDFL
ncbi:MULTISPECIES: prephenate/arogenate dehydrogenase [unclassified Cyanobium]|uniref:prephenate/arogenate dehydrogenase n=1 Tax=unclassified Cyanobium TaxID=2627006 RepID=UPI0020CC4C1D|nr:MULTISPECIES: prephenate/arogenate dehydrogenase [unclassified Cyanobium]MCP9858841.1 prephenate/arogenate dehydrogenase [Cyanobium sp. Cruz-8H5]MCP9866077.1 prephenate/arogenate dehydrogenase [Cyanobium sp. Cruz-8D1]